MLNVVRFACEMQPMARLVRYMTHVNRCDVLDATLVLVTGMKVARLPDLLVQRMRNTLKKTQECEKLVSEKTSPYALSRRHFVSTCCILSGSPAL